jgi:hypothetical protein
MNEDVLAAPHTQMFVDALKRVQARSRRGAGMGKFEGFWHMSDFIRGHHHIFGVEASLRIIPAVGIGHVADFKSSHS